MKNYVQDGDTLDLLAPYDVLSGAGFKVGSIIAIAVADALSGAAVQGVTEGVYDVKKTSAQAWTVGAKIYWDDTAKEFTSVSTSNTLVGAATAIAANPSSTGYVKLDGAIR